MENKLDSIRHGTSPARESHGMAKLTEEKVLIIRASAKSKTSALAVEFGVHRSTIYKVKGRALWA